MATPETLDIEGLLAPIPGDDPSGRWLMFEGPYDEIAAARPRPNDGAEGEWSKVVAVATDALARRSKDLRIAAWLTEGLIRREGFAGLRDGLRLLRELQERFWETAYPRPEDGDLEKRAAVVSWMNEHANLPAGVRFVPLTAPPESYTWFDFDESRATANLERQSAEKHQAALAEGKLSGEQFDKAVAATRRAFYEELLTVITESLQECERLEALIAERYGRDARGLGEVKKAIEDCRGLVRTIVVKKRELEPDASADGEVGPGAGAAGPRAPGSSGGPLPLEPRDRADALRRLGAVATFFKRTEPQSPVAYLVQRAIKWADMPLEEWLREVVASDDILSRVKETLGIKGG